MCVFWHDDSSCLLLVSDCPSPFLVASLLTTKQVRLDYLLPRPLDRSHHLPFPLWLRHDGYLRTVASIYDRLFPSICCLCHCCHDGPALSFCRRIAARWTQDVPEFRTELGKQHVGFPGRGVYTCAGVVVQVWKSYKREVSCKIVKLV